MSAQDIIADAIYDELNGKYGDFSLYDSPAVVIDALTAAGYVIVKLPEPDGTLCGDPAWQIGAHTVSPNRDGTVYLGLVLDGLTEEYARRRVVNFVLNFVLGGAGRS